MRAHDSLFEGIYATEKWGKGQGSGTGSDADYCRGWVEFLRQNIPAGTGVLDVGCGDMRMWEGNTDLPISWRYIGADVSDIALGMARMRFPNLTLVKLNAQDHEKLLAVCTTNNVEIVLFKDVLMHWTDEEIESSFVPFCEKFPGTVFTANSWRYWRKPRPLYPRVLDSYSMAPLDNHHPALVGLGFVEAGKYARGKKQILIRQGFDGQLDIEDAIAERS